MNNSTQIFKVINGNRRQFARSKRLTSLTPVRITLNNLPAFNAEIESLTFGRITLKILRTAILPASVILGNECNLTIESKFALEVSGKWIFRSQRHDTNHIYVVFEILNFSSLQAFEGCITFEVLHRSSRYRLLKPSEPGDLEELSNHFTETCDFPIPVPCKVIIRNQVFHGVFDFEARRKVLTFLDIKIRDDFSLQPDEVNVKIEYSFLSVFYILNVKINLFDQDFNTLVVHAPTSVLTVTARRFDRLHCNIPMHFKQGTDDIEHATSIVRISPTGADILFTQVPANLKVDDYFTLERTQEAPLLVQGIVRRINKNRVGIEFDNCTPLEDLKTLYHEALPLPFLFRNEENYQKFEELYVQVGYGPIESADRERWRKFTYDAWKTLDDLIPSNTVGYFDLKNKKLLTSFSIAVMSSNMLYGHSLAMEKSLHSIASFGDICVENLAWTDFVAGAEYWAGSARHRSSFATRLHSVFRNINIPDSFKMINALAVLPKETSSSGNQEIQIIPVDSFDLASVSLEIAEVIARIEKPHEILRGIHEIRLFNVMHSQSEKPVALIVGHKSPPFFTAANILRCAWVFMLDASIDVKNLVENMSADSYLKDLEFDIFMPNLRDIPTYSSPERQVEEVFWYYVHKDEFGSIISSIRRAQYSVIRKYGSEAEQFLYQFIL